MSFSFGLLHGFGFAGALQKIGLPKGNVPLPLLSFNLGVEAGQILFIAVVLIAAAALARIVPATLRAVQTPGSPVLTASAYLIGSVSAYWVIERIAAF